MQLKDCKWIVLLMILHVTSTRQFQYLEDSDYFYSDPEMEDDAINANSESESEQQSSQYYYPGVPRSNGAYRMTAREATTECEPITTTTECVPAGKPEETAPAPSEAPPSSESTTASGSSESTTASGSTKSTTASASTESTTAPGSTESTAAPGTAAPGTAAPGAAPAGGQVAEQIQTADVSGKSKELHQMVQHLYIAQARVQLEATEIKKAQSVANSAQLQLEEAANRVRSITATLQNAQQEVASAAIRAQTAQLQLAAHDQLLFAARQDVDALSSQMVGLQAAEGFETPHQTFDLGTLLERLKQPLPDAEKPTPIPPLVQPPIKGGKSDRIQDFYYD